MYVCIIEKNMMIVSLTRTKRDSLVDFEITIISRGSYRWRENFNFLTFIRF